MKPIVVATASFAVVLACGGAEPSAPPAVAAAVRITAVSGTLAQLAQTRMMATATTTDGAAISSPTFAWSSLDERIATVDATGMVTPRKPGSARIIARSGSVADTASITVGMRWLDVATTRGWFGTCGIGGDSTAYCWGGEHLTGGASSNKWTNPVEVAGGLKFGTVAVGSDFACGLTGSGVAYCWGNNAETQLGDGTRIESRTPVAVRVNAKFVQLSIGDASFACGLTASGDVYCWGNNAYGQIGDGAAVTFSVRPPTLVEGLPRVSQITAGTVHACGVAINGAAYCWGGNFWGSVGIGDLSFVVRPRAVVGGHLFRYLGAGVDGACGAATTGGVYCWGTRYQPTLASATPQLYPYTSEFKTIVSGGYHRCGLSAGGALCWGDNVIGSLGTGDLRSSAIPVPVLNSARFVRIIVGFSATCALDADGAAFCWGINDDAVKPVSTPRRVADPV